MDDVRFYNRGLSATEVTSAYGGALVDTNALVMQLNFTTAPGAGRHAHLAVHRRHFAVRRLAQWSLDGFAGSGFPL